MPLLSTYCVSLNHLLAQLLLYVAAKEQWPVL